MTDSRSASIAQIQAETARIFGVSVAEIKSQIRDRRVVRARQAAMWLARKITLRSYPEIGRAFGNRDHTTIMHGYQVVEALIGGDETFADQVERVRLVLAPIQPEIAA